MLSEVPLFDLKADGIHINIVARFEKENLIIDGYDIGPKVKEMLGDPDYEYIITVHEPEVKKLFQELALPTDDKEGLLLWLANNFNTNSCFSSFSEYLSSKGIKHETFTWR